MRGDFSRRTDDPRKHYSAVLQEQGRLLTDADLEEEHRILTRAHERTAADLVGGCGGPLGAAGFGISAAAGRLRISAGRYYAGGRLVVNEEEVGFFAQPHRHIPADAWPPPEGRFAVVLDVWPRLITALDDPAIREVALGGPTTSTREQTVWQVRFREVKPGWHCGDALPGAPTTTGLLAARAEPEAATSTPCLVPPSAGFTGLENQFYRVEVFATGDATDVAAPGLPVVGYPAGTTNQMELAPADAAGLAVGDAVEIVLDDGETAFAHVAEVEGAVVTLTARLPRADDGAALRPASAVAVFSRENGSVVTAIEAIDGVDVRVADLGPDDVLGFGPGQWVELSDDAVELEGLPRQLRQVESVDVDERVVRLRTPAAPLAGTAGGVDPSRHPKLRRWDGARAVAFAADGSGWIHLEHGIQVRFSAGGYVSGDHWHFPARAAVVDAESGTIEWPTDAAGPVELPPAGVAHHVCALAVVDVDPRASDPVTVVADCRKLFPPVTELTTLLYVGGDGQEVRPGSQLGLGLPAPLSVRVANGSHPVEGARVAFTGDGQFSPAEAVTDASGLAVTAWTLASGTPAQSCEAHLLGPDGAPIAHQRVRFHATIDPGGGGHRGCCVTVGEGGEFGTVDEAIKALLERGERDLCLCVMAGNHKVGELALPPPEDGRAYHLSIKGCGRLTRVFSDSLHVVGWSSLRLADLDVVVAEGTLLHSEAVEEVRIENVRAVGIGMDGAGYIRIHDAARVLVRDSTFEARDEAVTLEIGSSDEVQDGLKFRSDAEIVVENCTVGGVLALYGRVRESGWIDVRQRRMLREFLGSRVELGWHGGIVHLRGNRLQMVAVSWGVVDALRRLLESGGELSGAYGTFLATDNVFTGSESVIVARHVGLVGNEFTLAGVPDAQEPTVLLRFVGETAVATANRGARIPGHNGGLIPATIEETTRAFAEAVNLDVTFG